MLLSRRHFLAAGALSVLAPSSLVKARTTVTPLQFRFALNRGPWDASNTPFLLAQQKGYFSEGYLDPEFALSKNAEEALHRVASNEFDVGYLDLSVLLRFALEHPNDSPLYVMTVFDSSPASVVTWASSGVRQPQDLAGKTLAAVKGDGAFQLFPTFLKTAGINPASVKIRCVSLEEREVIMLNREVDGAIGFDSTIFYRLKPSGVTEKELDFLYYREGGLNLYSNGVIVSRKFLSDNPERISKVVRACALGWRDSLKDPKEMLNSMSTVAPGIDRAREAERFDWIINRQIRTPYTLSHGLGGVDPYRIQALIRQLDTSNGTTLKPEDIYSSAYLPPLEDRRVQ